MKSDIIVIGGGAAGLMAAYGAASSESRPSVTVLEKMARPGRKIMITGKGRCNFTNVKEWNEFSHHIRSKSNFVRPAFYNLNSAEVVGFMNHFGMETIIERGDRAFPASHRASDVVDALVRACTSSGVRIETGVEVMNIVCNESSEGPVFMLSINGTKTYSCNRLIIATGGLSYPTTGSTGDGYAWAEKFGHKIRQCFPSLTALVPKGYKDGKAETAIEANKGLKGHIDRSTPLTEIGQALCGNQLKNVGATLYIGNDEVQSEFGDLDFTDGGIEGPVGFELSRNCVKALINGGHARISIDLKHGISAEDLSARLKGLWNEVQKDPRSKRLSIKEMLKILLGKLMPWELIPGFLKCNQVLYGKKGNEHIDMQALCSSLKSWDFEIEGFVGYERSVVTAGGVDTDEVSPKSMESKLRKGLYFCGEVLDMDSDTGGYNLQTAFCTGFLAGRSAGKSL